MKHEFWKAGLLLSGLWCGLWGQPAQAEVKVIPVFEAEGMVRTLKDLYPELGVSALGNQLVLSGTPAQLREAESTLTQLNQPPQSLLIEWRVAGSASGQQLGVGVSRDELRQEWLVEGRGRHYESRQQDSWQVRGLSGRPVLLQMGSYQPVTFYRWEGGRTVGLMPLVNGLYATATLIGDRVQIALSSEQVTLDRGDIKTGQSATEVSGAPGQWLTVGALSTSAQQQEAGLSSQSQLGRGSEQDSQTLQVRVTRQ